MTRKILISTVLFGMLLFLTNGKCVAQTDLSAMFQQAEQCWRQSDYAGAEAIYKTIVDDNPGTDEAFTAQQQLALLCAEWGNQTKEDEAFTKLVTDFSEKVGLRSFLQGQLGNRYRELDRCQKARQVYQYVIDTWPNDDCAMYAYSGLVNAYLQERDYTEAISVVDGLFNRFASNENLPRVALELGYDFRSRRNWQKARELWRYYIANSPQDARAMKAQRLVAQASVLLGDDAAIDTEINKLLSVFGMTPGITAEIMELAGRCEKHKRFETVLVLYQYVLDHWPQDEHAIRAKTGIAQAYVALGDDDKVQETLRQLLATFGDHNDIAKAFDHVADSYRTQDKYAKASQLYQYIIDTWPNAEHTPRSRTGKLLSDSLLQTQSESQAEVEEGFSNLAEKLNSHPTLPGGVYSKAEQYFLDGDYPKAIDLWKLVLEKCPQNTSTERIPFLLGTCYERTDDYPKAIEYYKMVLQVYPDSPNAYRAALRIGRLYHELKDYQQAAYWFGKQYELYPDNPSTKQSLFWQGLVYLLKIGDYQKAGVAFQEYVNVYPNSSEAPWAYYNLAMCRENTGDKAQAISLLEEAVSKYPGSIYTQEITDKLAELREGVK